MPPTKQWKVVERKIARFIHPDGQRTPLSGSNSGHHTSADALLPYPLYIEAKHGKNALTIYRSTKVKLPRLFADVAKKAHEEDRVPVLVLHPPEWPGGVGAYPCFVRRKDWTDLGPADITRSFGDMVQIPLRVVRRYAVLYWDQGVDHGRLHVGEH
jgi:hypothetical protein